MRKYKFSFHLKISGKLHAIGSLINTEDHKKTVTSIKTNGNILMVQTSEIEFSIKIELIKIQLVRGRERSSYLLARWNKKNCARC